MTRHVLPIAAVLLALGCFGGGADPDDAADHEDHEDHDDHDDDNDHDGSGEGHAEVVLTPEAISAARIVVAPAQTGTLSGEIALPARIALDPRKEAIVSAWISGQVDAISVRSGDTVKRGQRLATVQSPELGEAIAAFRAAKARDDAADARLERLRRLEAEGVTARAQVLEVEANHAEAAGALEAAEERLRILGVDPSVGDPHTGEHYPSHVPVRAPIAGKVLNAAASVGRRVEPGDTLFHVGDLDEVWLLLDVYERDLPAVAADQAVRFEVEAWPGEVFEGRVEQVGDWVEPDSRTVEVRVVVPNPDHRLKPNMYAQARLTTGGVGSQTGIVVPASATQELDGAPVVFVQTAEGRFEARPIEIADRNSATVLVASGLEPGESVVVDGAFALKSELEKGELGEGHAH